MGLRSLPSGTTVLYMTPKSSPVFMIKFCQVSSAAPPLECRRRQCVGTALGVLMHSKRARLRLGGVCTGGSCLSGRVCLSLGILAENGAVGRGEHEEVRGSNALGGVAAHLGEAWRAAHQDGAAGLLEARGQGVPVLVRHHHLHRLRLAHGPDCRGLG
eukprot:638193-Rhodomonas_salina.6